MNETLRPSTLGEILDRTVQLYRRNFLLFAGIGALPVGVMIALTVPAGALWALLFGTSGDYPDMKVGVFAVAVVLLFLLAVPIYIAAAVFSMGGLTQAAVSTHHGENMTIRGALAAVRPFFWRYLWYAILQALWVALLPLAIAFTLAIPLFVIITKTHDDVTAGVAAGFLLFFIFAAAFGVIVWRTLGYSIGFAVCVAEQKPAWESLNRAWSLSDGTRGRILVMYLLLFALSFALSMATSIPFLIVVTLLGVQGGNEHSVAFIVAEVLRLIGNFCLQALLAPFSWIALVIFYFDQRIRKEGYDIVCMMNQAGMLSVQNPFAASPPAEPQWSTPPSEAAPTASLPPETSVNTPVTEDSHTVPDAPPDTVEER